jgi:hypothetical protein
LSSFGTPGDAEDYDLAGVGECLRVVEPFDAVDAVVGGLGLQGGSLLHEVEESELGESINNA